MDSQRLETLEMKTAYLENYFEQLQQVVIEQQKSLDALKVEVLRQRDLILALREAMGDPIEQKRPPHY